MWQVRTQVEALRIAGGETASLEYYGTYAGDPATIRDQAALANFAGRQA